MKEDGVCLCAPGWQGPTCAEKCTPGFHGDKCSQQCLCDLDRGTCHHVTGDCICHTPGFAGIACNETCENVSYT